MIAEPSHADSLSTLTVELLRDGEEEPETAIGDSAEITASLSTSAVELWCDGEEEPKMAKGDSATALLSTSAVELWCDGEEPEMVRAGSANITASATLINLVQSFISSEP